MRKGGQLVDDGRETARRLWTTAGASLAGPATPAVENRSAHVDECSAIFRGQANHEALSHRQPHTGTGTGAT